MTILSFLIFVLIMLKGKIDFLLIKEKGEVASFHLWKDAILWTRMDLLSLHPSPSPSPPPNQTHKLHIYILPPLPPPKQTKPKFKYLCILLYF